MRYLLIVLNFLLLLLVVSAAHAQVRVDFAKITCRQYIFDKKISLNATMIADWLSGYFSGKNSSTVIDVGAVAANKDKVEDYCRHNLDAALMEAASAALGRGK